eukprot:3377576-Pleurochrysis_carterae.AAC.1
MRGGGGKPNDARAVPSGAMGPPTADAPGAQRVAVAARPAWWRAQRGTAATATPRAVAEAGPAPSATLATAERAVPPRGTADTQRTASAEVIQRADARAAAARRVQAKAAGLQLTGALSERRDD